MTRAHPTRLLVLIGAHGRAAGLAMAVLAICLLRPSQMLTRSASARLLQNPQTSIMRTSRFGV